MTRRAKVVKAMHHSLHSEHGGLAGRVNEVLLDASLARPQQRVTDGYPTSDLFELAACYGFAFARNHCFSDGNKRIALMAMYTFLAINHIELGAIEEEAVLVMQDLAAGKLSEVELAAWVRLRAHVTN